MLWILEEELHIISVWCLIGKFMHIFIYQSLYKRNQLSFSQPITKYQDISKIKKEDSSEWGGKFHQQKDPKTKVEKKKKKYKILKINLKYKDLSTRRQTVKTVLLSSSFDVLS